jgi:hypothetical protein
MILVNILVLGVAASPQAIKLHDSRAFGYAVWHIIACNARKNS